MFTTAVLISRADNRTETARTNHPLAIPRVPLFMELVTKEGLLHDEDFVPTRPATLGELEWFHDPDYIAAIRTCETRGSIPLEFREKYNIGNFENPFFPEFFNTPASAAGATILGAEAVLNGQMAFAPMGGMHHTRSGQARGFGIFNDVVLGICRLRQERLRVLYLDMDAHHGDGVEEAFSDDPDVLVCSFHMDTGYAYPQKGGKIGDRGEHGNVVNLPFPRTVNDSEYRLAVNSIWPRLFDRFGPDAVVLQAGTDILYPDPLGKFDVSNRLFLETVEYAMELAPRYENGVPRLLVTGGGGYHPIALARCWLGVWCLLTGQPIPENISAQGQALLRSIAWDDDEDEPYFESLFATVLDDWREGQIRPEIIKLIQRCLNGFSR